MTSNAHTEDENNDFHPDNLRYYAFKNINYANRFKNEGPYNDIDVIRAEMSQLRKWCVDKDSNESNKLNPKSIKFADFLDKINEQDKAAQTDKADEQERRKVFQEALFDEKLTALCLSGGGIRSASFCLGVLQALSKEKMLSGFDYISTVSGGGYIGGWLSAWASHDKQPSEPANCQCKSEAIGIEAVQEALSSRIECDQITNLRKYTNFLSPRVGFMSLDTRVLWITYLRNLFLNSLLFIPALLAVIIVVKFFSLLIPCIARMNDLISPDSHFLQFLWLIILAITYLTYFLFHGFKSNKMLQLRASKQGLKSPFKLDKQNSRSLSTYGQSPAEKKIKQVASICYAIIGITSAGIMTSPVFSQILTCEQMNLWGFVWIGGVIWAFAFLLGWYLQEKPTEINDDPTKKNNPNDDLFKLFFCNFFSGLASGAIFLLGFYVLNGFMHGFIGFENSMHPGSTDYCVNRDASLVNNYTFYRLAIYFGPLVPIAADFVGSAIFSALISKTPDMDHLQEWSARMLSWLFMLGGGWLILSLIATPSNYIPLISDIQSLFNWLIGSQSELKNNQYLITFILVIASGISVAIYGKSSNTSVAPHPNESKYSRYSKNLALLGGIIFLYMIMLSLSSLLDKLVFSNNLFSKLNYTIQHFFSLLFDYNEFMKSFPRIESVAQQYEALKGDPSFVIPQTMMGSILLLLFFSFVILASFTLLFSCFINVNTFSLHRYYRNRLIRSFLGSVNTKRDPDSFTNFDQKDNIDMSNLTEKSPLLIINAALNLLNDDNLAWQERKASSFSISRLFCGNKEVGYRPSKGSISGSGYGENISLGTAMAISGAAVSPNMGYNSSPIITFVMTLFNARLGWWLGNPQYDLWREIGPRYAIYYYICELFGLTDDHQEYVYLSDGGHFENLGAYEMIRRCCRTIVIVDAGCDPDSKFEDLGKLIRLARIDFNAEITFNREFELTDGETRHFTPTPAGDNQCPPYCLVGEIEYCDIESRGTIIYIKPGVHGDEPRDVLSYHALHPVFPHEPTSDQFFSESQFESYRKLGLHIGKKVFKAIAI